VTGVVTCTGSCGARLIRKEKPPDSGAIYQDTTVPNYIPMGMPVIYSFRFCVVLYYDPDLTATPVPGDEWTLDATISYLDNKSLAETPVFTLTQTTWGRELRNLVPWTAWSRIPRLESGREVRVRLEAWSSRPKKIWLTVDDVQLSADWREPAADPCCH